MLKPTVKYGPAGGSLSPCAYLRDNLTFGIGLHEVGVRTVGVRTLRHNQIFLRLHERLGRFRFELDYAAVLGDAIPTWRLARM